MANLFNFLTNFKNNMGNNNAGPTMEAIQLDDNGNIDAGKSLQLKQETTPLSFADRLLGRKYEMDTIQTDPETGSTTMQTATNFKSGLLNDLDAGLRENYGNDFKVSNLAPDNKKGFAYRFGEGLGTLSKVLAGTGGDAYIAGTQGLDAAMNRQAYRTNDRLYRDALIQSGQNSLMMQPQFRTLKPEEQQLQLNSIADKINNYRGFISDKAFNQLLTAKQLQDNAEYRNLYLDSQLKNQELANQIARERLDYQKISDSADRNLRSRGLDIEEQKIKNEKEKSPVKFTDITTIRKEFNSLPAIKNSNEIKRQFDNVTNIYNAYKSGKLKANAADQAIITTLNKILDPTSVVRESEFARTAAGQSLFAQIEGYANKLSKGGGGLTDKEREDLYIAMQEMYNANQEESQAYIKAYTDLADRYGINRADIMPRQYYQPSQIQTTTTNEEWAF